MLILKKVSRQQINHDKSPSMKRVKIHHLIMHFNLCILWSHLSADFLKWTLPVYKLDFSVIITQGSHMLEKYLNIYRTVLKSP